MSLLRLFILTVLLALSNHCEAQIDSTIEFIQKIPAKYISRIDNKIDKYSNRITFKTEKTLVKLSRWENKIKSMLEKVSPETAARLFSNGQMTFSTALQKLKEGKAVVEGYKTKYNEYSDKLTTSIKYLDEQKDKLNKNIIGPLNKAKQKLNELEKDVANTEAIEQFIKERKNELIDEVVKYIGKSKYLQKINKESYYYVETLRNYKEIFSDKKKVEELAFKILNKIPAFQKFAEKNSMLAGLFAPSSSFTSLSRSGSSIPVVNGLASRASLQQFVAMNTALSAGSNPFDQIRKQMTDVSSPLNEWKNKLSKLGGMGNKNLPDFKSNSQRTKTFRQRLEFGTDLQFGKRVNYMPATSDIGIKVGYKLNDKSSAGIGVNYKVGLGKGFNNIKITSEGLGLRTYLKWKVKNLFDVQGGSEWNYMLRFSKIEQLKNSKAWQQSALIGLSRSYNVSNKLKGNIQILYDFLYSTHLPRTQPLVFRFGYSL